MLLQHFFVEKIAHSSYIIVGSHNCAVVDPRRDTDVYLEWAGSRGFEITHVLETHLHADFVSGHLDLAEETGARIYAPRTGNCRFEHEPVAEGDVFEIDDLQFRVLDTAGHTPEHVSYVVVDRARGTEPVGVFCGDTLFVGDVGRPDLFPGRAEELAGKLFDNLHSKLLKLPDFCEVWPAHGAGSLCGRAMGSKWRSTIGYERLYNSALQTQDRGEFVKSLTTEMPSTPDHFARCSDINRNGPRLVRELPEVRPMSASEFRRAEDTGDYLVLDIRPYDAFGGQHVPDSRHIDFGGNFATFAGWVIPPENRILLVATNREQAEQAVVWLRRVGLDRTTGFLDGGMFSWAKAGLPTRHLPQLSAKEVYEMTAGAKHMVILDVRSPTEFQSGHIDGAVNIPAPDLRNRYEELDSEADTVITCSTGHRSTLAASILLQHGFARLHNMAGGMTGYSAAGHAPDCPVCFIPHGPQFLGWNVGQSVKAELLKGGA
ncbi:MBL fold metallo-hydrolase [candidate division WOR-3 bacterium]|nr:MBL fold metallo-hydrolase [candidate division WOR-3 bacterium]